MLSQVQRRAFERDGVVCVRGALSMTEVERLRTSIDTAVAAIGTTPTGYDVTGLADAAWSGAEIESRGDAQYNLAGFASLVRATSAERLRDERADDGGPKGRFFVETGTWTRCADMRVIALASELPAIAGAVLDARQVRFYDDQVFVKEPGTVERTAFHQDLGYFHIEGDQGCVMWAPVDHADRSSGALGYVRGSHRWRKTYKPNVFMSRLAMPGSEGDDLPDIDNNEDKYDIVYFDVEPGDVVIHHFRTVHGSHGNASTTRTRRAASLRYVSEHVRFRRRSGAPAQPHRPLDWPDGAELSDPWFPLAWRRRAPAVAAE
jgi:hypothetical protein